MLCDLLFCPKFEGEYLTQSIFLVFNTHSMIVISTFNYYMVLFLNDRSGGGSCFSSDEFSSSYWCFTRKFWIELVSLLFFCCFMTRDENSKNILLGDQRVGGGCSGRMERRVKDAHAEMTCLILAIISTFMLINSECNLRIVI